MPAFLILALVFIAIAFADGAYIRNFQQRGPATFEIESNDLIAAHPSLPSGTPVTITNLQNNAKIIVTVVDKTTVAAKRVIVLSKGAAANLGADVKGVIPIILFVDRIKIPVK